MKKLWIVVGVMLGMSLIYLAFHLMKSSVLKSTETPAAERVAPAVGDRSIPQQSDKGEAASELEAKGVAAFQARNTVANVPITFYGKVADQNDDPIQGAQVTMAVSARGLTPLGVALKEIPLEVFTDGQGQFSVSRQRGTLLAVKGFKKEGYLMNSGVERNFSYSDSSGELFKANPQQPVIFRLWKKGLTEPLIKRGIGGNIIADGRMYNIDLVANKISDKALSQTDLRVMVKRPAKVEPSVPYEWTFAIEAVDGGIIETHDDYLYRAPNAGYEPGYEYVTQPDANAMKWHSNLKKKFYLKSRGGKVYASLDVEVYQQLGDMAGVSLNVLVNPAGSRNLEYSLDKKINSQ